MNHLEICISLYIKRSKQNYTLLSHPLRKPVLFLKMNCLQSLPRSSSLSLQGLRSRTRTSPFANNGVVRIESCDLRRSVAMNAYSGPTASTHTNKAEVHEEKSEIYSTNMTHAMGTVLTYKHELGMSYNFIRPDIIVGSCLQTAADVDKLCSIGVKTIFCVQQNSDLEYFSVDIGAIKEYAKKCSDIEHCHVEVRDFDAFDLRMKLPIIVSKLCKAIRRNGGVTYIHCTAGLGRAPSVALAYMFWVQGYKLSEAHNLLQSKRPCFPKMEAIKSATADILTGIGCLSKNLITLMWEGHNCSSVEVSGLDIGWGQRIPLKFDENHGNWTLERELPEGQYEYKYIVNGEWTCNKYEMVTSPNGDGHVNNYVQVYCDMETQELRTRLARDNIYLMKAERILIREFLER
ncbi:hypothetical protein QJS10_CPA09g01829 [Acorus calamus]|uniref:Dual specificity protein phosphatase 4 n=1 Tax=Acorus calamus TaxID=4465 RepID=A0AAV9E5V5_ACOCL|nr:hypothetical protein QJS10_CPA09g01829 [Acorus calamus]